MSLKLLNTHLERLIYLEIESSNLFEVLSSSLEKIEQETRELNRNLSQTKGLVRHGVCTMRAKTDLKSSSGI